MPEAASAVGTDTVRQEDARRRALAERYPAHAEAPRLYGPGYTADVAAFHERLRARYGPVAPVRVEGDLPAWLVLGYREAVDVTSRADLYARDSRLWTAWDLVPPGWPVAPVATHKPAIAWSDGAEHRRRSGALYDALGALDPFELRARYERLADELVDAFAPDGKADLIAQFAEPLPLLATTSMLGLNPQDVPLIIAAMIAVLNQGPDTAEADARLRATMFRQVARARENPGFDLISRLVRHPAALTDAEIFEDVLILFALAQQATAGWIGNTLRLLLADPRFAVTVSGNRRTAAQAMAEVLWTDPPHLNLTGRWATRSGTLGGQRVQAGDWVIVAVAGAHADPALRTQDRVPLPGGGNQAHLAFGHGPHRCPLPGQEMAESLTHTAVEVLLDRLPDIRLAVPAAQLTWRPAVWMRALVSLPVAFGIF